MVLVFAFQPRYFALKASAQHKHQVKQMNLHFQ